jgi:hypothetical protein
MMAQNVSTLALTDMSRLPFASGRSSRLSSRGLDLCGLLQANAREKRRGALVIERAAPIVRTMFKARAGRKI